MQPRTRTLLAIALPMALLSPAVFAQDQQSTDVNRNATARQPMTPLNSDMSQATYSHLDKNRDGKVSAEEAQADPSFRTRPKAKLKQKATQDTSAAIQTQSTDDSTDHSMDKDNDKDTSTTDSTPTPP